MTLAELKTMLNEGQAPTEFIVLVCKENHFIADQYIDRICQIKHTKETALSSIYEPFASSLSLVMNYDEAVNVLRVEKFEEKSEDYSQFSNTIVVCDEIDKPLVSPLKKYTIAIPALADWQVKAYIDKLCPLLEQSDVDWLYEATGGNIYRILSELDKITIFDPVEQRYVFTEIQKDSELYPHNDFIISNALENNNKKLLAEALLHIDAIKCDPIAVVNTILKKLKNLAMIKLGGGVSATDLGISPQQYKWIDRNASYPLDKLFNDIEFLSGIDLKLKSSQLELTPNKLLDYIICKLA